VKEYYLIIIEAVAVVVHQAPKEVHLKVELGRKVLSTQAMFLQAF